MSRIAREAHKTLKTATDYATWRQAAETLDTLDGNDDWKAQDDSADYDWRLIRAKLQRLRSFRQQGQTQKMVHLLRQGLHGNLGNIGNPMLYDVARVGTKRLIVQYLEEVAAALEDLAAAAPSVMPLADKRRFFHDVQQSYGQSSLMLSGGATLGLFHLGVVRALHQQGLLPTVLSGSSAGAIVAAAVASRTPDELEELLGEGEAYFRFWRLLSIRQMLKRRALMDRAQLKRAVARNVADLTFEEAYDRSGFIVNITVSPASENQPARLLNYLTFPYLFLREAVVASCALPVLFQPVMLMTRDESGARVPYMPTLRWNDGSLQSDLPMMRTRRLHNVNHFIVSQTNPHVLPFLPTRDTTDDLREAARNYAYTAVRTQATSLLSIGRSILPMERLRRPLQTAVNVLEQEYRGDINIRPELSPWNYVELAANPSREVVHRFSLEGERAAWAHVETVRLQTLVGRTLSRCLKAIH